MNRDKQIEEMAKDIFEHCSAGLFEDEAKEIAHFVIEGQGYRKASEVAEEVIKELERMIEVKIIGFEEDFFHGTAAHWDGIRKNCYEEMLVELAELKKKYTEGGK